jgi:putative membrane protein insertion efficiency factor
MTAALATLLRAVLRAYQLVVSPLLGPACRFAPSCSEYAREAIELHGPGRGSWLAVRRLCRCHPLGGSGFDPVPPAMQRPDHLGHALVQPSRSDA